MGDDITIGVTEIVNNIEVTAQPNDQIVDISVIDNTDEVTLNITPTVIEINVNKGSSYAKWGVIVGTLSDQEDLQDALDLKADLVDGKVPSSQLPSYVDDVIEVANYAALPAVGESGKIYITLDDNHIFRWTGSTYVEITDNTAVWGAITGTLSSQTDLQSALNAKALKTTTISTNAPLSGGGDLSANRTLSISQAGASTDGYLSSTDWNTFNSKLSSLSGAVLTTTDQSVAGVKTFTNLAKFTNSTFSDFYAIEIDVNSVDALVVKDNGTTKLQIGKNGEILGAKYKVSGGFSSQFLKANGDLDSNTYALDNSVVKLTGDQTVAGSKTFTSDVKSTAFRLTGGTTGTGLYYGHTNKVVLANYTVGGGIDFETNGGAVNMILNGNGNLGIGVDPSAWDSLWKVLQLSYGSLYSSIYSNVMAHNLYVAGEDTKYISSNFASQYEQNSGAHWWYTAPTGTAGANMTLSPRMILDNSGKLGIGITSPTEALDVVGAINVSSAIRSSGEIMLRRSGNELRLGSGVGADYSVFYAGGSERMRITSGGNVGIGNTGYSNIRFATRGADTSSSNWSFWSEDSAGTTLLAARNDGAVFAGSIGTSTGTALVLTSGGYIVKSSSSIRYKKNVNPIDIGLDFILSLNPVSYNLKEGNESQVGFIAEDFPDERLVSMSMIDPMNESKGFQKEGVNYSQIVAPLTKAIQELYEQIQLLKSEIEILKQNK
jgi:hypothetical protein